ncbi:MAG: Hint domain-containing protein [Alphaproteobacteria bacterium]|nr:Hint domain-containing protein [Alphaproteobacteria bacterium]
MLSGTNGIPGAADDVTIDAVANYVVTIQGAQAARDVVLNAAGGRLEIDGTLSLGGTLTQQAGTLQLPAGGVLQGGSVHIVGGGTDFTGGTIDGVTWIGPMAVPRGTVVVANQVTLKNADGSAHGTLDLQDQGTIEFVGSQTLDDAVVHIPSLSGEGASVTTPAGSTLTLGPNLQLAGTINGGAALTFGGGGTIVNAGSLAIQALGPVFGPRGLLVVGDTFVNQGIIDLRGIAAMNANQGLVNNGGIFNAGSGVYVTGDLTGTGTVTLAADLFVSGTISSGQHLSAYNSIFTLSAAGIQAGATLDGFGQNGKIDLTGVAFDGNINAFWAGSPAGGTLTIKDGSVTKASIFLTGISNTATFHVAADTNSVPGTAITTNNVPCFLSGTAIRTPYGDVAIETIRAGDSVIALKSGSAKPVRWIGSRRIVTAHHPLPESVWPVCLRRDAIAPGVPCRDLFVSPEHALFLHGVLVPARHLLNGSSIVQVPVPVVVYYHIELERHDLVLAESQPSETFLDMGNRVDFDNGGSVQSLHPTFGGGVTADEYWRLNACAPQVRGGADLEAIRRSINSRAALPVHSASERGLRAWG